jgi:3-oxoacyl-[acyl-carrier-protein] synthase-1
LERFEALARPAIEEALAPLAELGTARGPVPALVGLPESRPGLTADLGPRLASRLDRRDSKSMTPTRTATLPLGHASGLMALEDAWRTIQQGDSELCLAGGVDSYLDPETLEWLDQGGQLMSGENRSGFPPGEGAGFCLLTSTRKARQLGLDILAWVVSAATSMEPNRIKTETICVGKGLSEAVLRATATLKLPEEKIHTIYCDMNGERYRSEEFTLAALRIQAAVVSVTKNLTPADCWGDMGAASGPLYANLAVASGLRGYAEGPRMILWAGSEGGHRSAAVLHVPLRSGETKS